MKDYHDFLKTKIIQNKVVLIRSHKILFYFSLALIPLIIYLLSYLTGVAAEKLTPRPDPLVFSKAADYPLLERTFLPVVTAKAAYIIDNTSQVVLFAKNDQLRFSPASTTKIMTALVALDKYQLTDILTIQRKNVEPVIVGFPFQDKVTFENMLYGMLVPSGNDAALAIADNYPGGEDAFVAAMNKKAQLLHLDNTHFGDPVGLDDTDDYTTVRDMAHLASFAINHPILSKVVGTKEKIITDNLGNQYDLKSTNKLLGLYGVNGVKTGYTGEAGEVLVTSALINGHTFIIVVMKSDDRFADTEKLLQLLQNVSFVKIRP